MSSFRFYVPPTSPTEPIVVMGGATPLDWLKWWSTRYDVESDDDQEYVELIRSHREFCAEHYRRIGKWKDGANAAGRWKPDVASVAYVIWEQSAREMPQCPDEREIPGFLEQWANRKYTDTFKTGPVHKKFGLSRATTLLHFLSGGRYPIFDSRVRTAIARLLDQEELSGSLSDYINSCLPVVKVLAQCCQTDDLRRLDKALFSYGALNATAFSNSIESIRSRPERCEGRRPTERDACVESVRTLDTIQVDVRCSVYPLGRTAPEGCEAVELYVDRAFEYLIEKPDQKVRMGITISLPTGDFEAGLRTYPPTGEVYICPDLRRKTDGRKVSLAKALNDSGIKPKDAVAVRIGSGIWKVSRL